MAIFDKNDTKSSTSSETTIIANGAKIDGVFNFKSRLHVDGEIVGEIHSKSVITVGKNGKIKGSISAGKLIVNGIFEGDADCDSVDILDSGKFFGKVTSKELMIEAKAQFEGESKIKRENAVPFKKDEKKVK